MLAVILPVPRAKLKRSRAGATLTFYPVSRAKKLILPNLPLSILSQSSLTPSRFWKFCPVSWVRTVRRNIWCSSRMIKNCGQPAVLSLLMQSFALKKASLPRKDQAIFITLTILFLNEFPPLSQSLNTYPMSPASIFEILICQRII